MATGEMLPSASPTYAEYALQILNFIELSDLTYVARRTPLFQIGTRLFEPQSAEEQYKADQDLVNLRIRQIGGLVASVQDAEHGVNHYFRLIEWRGIRADDTMQHEWLPLGQTEDNTIGLSVVALDEMRMMLRHE